MKQGFLFLVLVMVISCHPPGKDQDRVINSDVDLYWKAYDQVVQEKDSLRQIVLIDSLYLRKGSIGLQKMVEVKGYTPRDYVELINDYPKFWTSIRPNTYRADQFAEDLEEGVSRLKALYPELRPAKIFFTVGAMRSNGTTQDSMVLIGSELAMADSLTDISEFEGRTKEWLENFFGTNPIAGLVLLNVHEYVHTQQDPIPSNLLYQVLYEGIAEFLSVEAMGVPSNSPAIAFGKNNAEVKKKFEEEMFYEKTHEWLWSNAPNEFGVRDLGYYIGYAIAEKYYRQAQDKLAAVKELIELDYHETEKVDALIDSTGFFSKKIGVLRSEYEQKRPDVLGVQEFENGSQSVSPAVDRITVTFSEPLNGYNTGVDYGELGEEAFPKVTDRRWSDDAASWSLEVELEPERRYQILITQNFQTVDGIRLRPYLIDFRTTAE